MFCLYICKQNTTFVLYKKTWGQHDKFCTQKMKTQISELISGEANVRRDLNHAKYRTAEKSTSFGDYAGTNSTIRKVIAQKVISENPEDLHLTIKGKNFCMKRQQSLSGKTIWWVCDLSDDDFSLLSGLSVATNEKKQLSYTMTIWDSMKCQITVYARRNERAEWKMQDYFWLGEEYITIV